MINEKLKELRKERHLTQKEISNYLDISQSTYAGYETGKHEPDIKTLIKLADLFKVSIDYIVGRYNKKEDSKEYKIKKT